MQTNKTIYLPVNIEGNKLSIETLRSFTGCDHYSDEEAILVIESLLILAQIMVQNFRTSMQTDNQSSSKTITLQSPSQNIAA